MEKQWIAAIALSLVLAYSGNLRAENESFSDNLVKAAQPILNYALDLIGTPYKFGGTNPEKGLDCSGYVRHVYKEAADIDLPHNAKQISSQGEAVSKEALQPGDLVFFNTMRKSFSHVGIYTGNDKFVHAASSRTGAVVVSDLNEKYWSRHFDGARRILLP